MQVSNNYNQPNFTSIYRIKNCNNQSFNEIFYKNLLKHKKDEQSVEIFCGNNPLESDFRYLLSKRMKKVEKYRDRISDFLKEKSLVLPEKDKFSVWVFTGQDANIPKNFRKKGHKTAFTTLKEYLIKDDIKDIDKFISAQNIPQKDKISMNKDKIQLLISMIKENKKYTDSFNEIMKNKQLSINS